MRNKYDKREPKIQASRWGTWRVRFYDHGDGQYREKHCSTKTEAQNLRRAIITDDNLSQWFPEKFDPNEQIKTFRDLAEKWLDHGEHVRRISKSCLHTYRSHLKHHVYPTLGNILLKKLKLDHIEALAKEVKTKVPMTKSYQAIRKNRWDEIEDDGEFISLSYQREILTVACMITTWASKRRPPLLQINPFETFKLPETPEHLYDYWMLEEEDKFLDWIESGGYYQAETTRYKTDGTKSVINMQIRNPEELRDIVLFALRTGMRLGEIGALRNMDVDLARGFIVVRATYCSKERVRKNTTKNKRSRRIEINGDVRAILEKRKFKAQKEPVFNIHMNSIRYFSRTCRWAGVKEIHFHSLRHTCLTNLANGYGMVKALPLPKVQQIAGHLDIKTTMRYVHGDLINDTASLQLSREERRSVAEEKLSPSPQTQTESKRKGLRLVISGRD